MVGDFRVRDIKTITLVILECIFVVKDSNTPDLYRANYEVPLHPFPLSTVWNTLLLSFFFAFM